MRANAGLYGTLATAYIREAAALVETGSILKVNSSGARDRSRGQDAPPHKIPPGDAVLDNASPALRSIQGSIAIDQCKPRPIDIEESIEVLV